MNRDWNLHAPAQAPGSSDDRAADEIAAERPMTIGEHPDLSELSDDELLRGLQLMVRSERRAVARVLAHLAEVEARKLHLRIGCSSLYD
jgi:hypothetical protein